MTDRGDPRTPEFRERYSVTGIAEIPGLGHSSVPGLSVLTDEPSGFRGRKELLNRAASRHWSQLVPNMSADI